MLVRHGYGVLLFSGRGTGDSDGSVNSYGWGREKDAAAALDYLATREDVQPGRVGALGLSTGADMAIDIAARRHDVHAVVADGTAAIGYEDVKEYTDNPVTRLGGWVMFKALEIIQGRSGPDASLADQIARSRAPHLLIAAGKIEKSWGELYDRGGSAAPSSGICRMRRTPPRCAVPRRIRAARRRVLRRSLSDPNTIATVA
jgi:hypothetical protein